MLNSLDLLKKKTGGLGCDAFADLHLSCCTVLLRNQKFMTASLHPARNSKSYMQCHPHNHTVVCNADVENMFGEHCYWFMSRDSQIDAENTPRAIACQQTYSVFPYACDAEHWYLVWVYHLSLPDIKCSGKMSLWITTRVESTYMCVSVRSRLEMSRL